MVPAVSCWHDKESKIKKAGHQYPPRITKNTSIVVMLSKTIWPACAVEARTRRSRFGVCVSELLHTTQCDPKVQVLHGFNTRRCPETSQGHLTRLESRGFCQCQLQILNRYSSTRLATVKYRWGYWNASHGNRCVFRKMNSGPTRGGSRIFVAYLGGGRGRGRRRSQLRRHDRDVPIINAVT